MDWRARNFDRKDSLAAGPSYLEPCLRNTKEEVHQEHNHGLRSISVHREGVPSWVHLELNPERREECEGLCGAQHTRAPKGTRRGGRGPYLRVIANLNLRLQSEGERLADDAALCRAACCVRRGKSGSRDDTRERHRH